MAEWAATFRVKFHDDGEFQAKFGDVIEVQHGYDPYHGEYIVIPKTFDQILATNGKNMEDDVTVKEIPYAETTNEYGVTVTIAS